MPNLNQKYTRAEMSYLRSRKGITEARVLEILDSLDECRTSTDQAYLQVKYDAEFLAIKICYNHRDKIPEKYAVYKNTERLLQAFESTKASGKIKPAHDLAYIARAIAVLKNELDSSKTADKLATVRLQP